MAFNGTASLAYTKKWPSLPPTTIRIEAEPCMDAFEQSSSPGQKFYGAEVVTHGCTTEQFSGLTYDPRYRYSGLNTNLDSVQSDNGVLDIL